MTGYEIGKRLVDLAVCGLALLICSIPMLLVAAVIRLSMGSPVFFRQQRPGLRGRPFEILKFRTMREHPDNDGDPAKDRQRITGLGRFLRTTSIDELPELWNVVKGDMSLVGPRPLLMEYLDLYSAEQRRRHDVLPGITGWAQVNGRNSLTWDEKFTLDIWYVDNRCLRLDLKILARTVASVFRTAGVNSTVEETMPRFSGNKEDLSEREES